MTIRCVWEHNGDDSLLHCVDYVGAYTRGESLDAAISKVDSEIRSYLTWKGDAVPDYAKVEIIQEKACELCVSDADSDVIFDTESLPLSMDEYLMLKALALRSADDFYRLYNSIPDKDKSCLSARKTFYGNVPRTAREMYEHTKNVNAYYFGEIGIAADKSGTILECREKGFLQLEKCTDFLNNTVFDGSYGEQWSLRKVLRRFVWHDRIHAKAMYRMAIKTFDKQSLDNRFGFIL